MIRIVSVLKKCSALIVKPVPVAKKIVTVLINAFWDVSDKRSVTPDSRNKLPNINIPKREVIEGNNKEIKIVATIGNTILSKRVTSRNCSITTSRSFCVVNNFITGGWINGTKDI